MSHELIPRQQNELIAAEDVHPPAIIDQAGFSARLAWGEFILGEIRNELTRKAYRLAATRFFGWCEARGIDLAYVTPGIVGQYFKQHPGGPATRKQHLAAVRKVFDTLVLRHAVIFNPALSVRTERYQVIEGKTPEISIAHAERLLGSIDVSNVVGLRDRAVIATLIFTAARVGAVAKLHPKHFQHDGS
jgi:site-specific recombinase XerD